ncbi:DUF2785 domain-containing protein [Paraglaciecola sp.]|uniref:DUF2785 domain-containing protein n=1 Tax=Paraglaciecola sp. TaxID=1920173 RepID=UPI003EF833B5
MMKLNRLSIFIVLLVMPLMANAEQCMNHFTMHELEILKEEKFEIDSVKNRNNTALKLFSCLGYPDPKIRDGIVYEAMSYWLRNDLLKPNTIKLMFDSLTKTLSKANQDSNNFTQPFAALVFSEVIRVDRLMPYLSDKERQKAVDVSTEYMRNIQDYRGFDDTFGWRHAVAHTADVFLQLSLNKQISRSQLAQLLSALKTQVSPQNSHFYTYGEPKRLATAFVYIILRAEQTEQGILSFFDYLGNPAPFDNWRSVYQSQKGLAKLHNTRNFVYSVLAITGQSQNPKLKAIQPMLIRIIKQLG